MTRLSAASVLFLCAFTSSASATSATEDGRQSLLSCRFGPECTRDAGECDSYETWIILRYYQEEDRYTLYHTLEQREEDAWPREMGAMTIFETEGIGDGQERFGRSFRMVVGPTLEAALQSARVDKADDGELAFNAEAHNGMCRVIE